MRKSQHQSRNADQSHPILLSPVGQSVGGAVGVIVAGVIPRLCAFAEEVKKKRINEGVKEPRECLISTTTTTDDQKDESDMTKSARYICMRKQMKNENIY